MTKWYKVVIFYCNYLLQFLVYVGNITGFTDKIK